MYMRVSTQFSGTLRKSLTSYFNLPEIAVVSSCCSRKTYCTSRTIRNTHRYKVDILNSSKKSGVVQLVWNLKYSSGTLNCWKCGSDLEDLTIFCNTCHVIQRPDTKLSFFTILGLEENYEVKLSDLTKKYRKLQNVLHPDRFTNREDEEKRLSEEFSSFVNKAYFTLQNPLKRGLYMLEQNGIYIEEGKTQSSPEFLMEIMERNEDVDNAKNAEQLDVLDKQNKERIDNLIREVTRAFKMKNMKLAEEILTKMKYYASIDSKIKELKQKNI